jgi:hypothetical protein
MLLLMQLHAVSYIGFKLYVSALDEQTTTSTAEEPGFKTFFSCILLESGLKCYALCGWLFFFSFFLLRWCGVVAFDAILLGITIGTGRYSLLNKSFSFLGGKVFVFVFVFFCCVRPKDPCFLWMLMRMCAWLSMKAGGRLKNLGIVSGYFIS